MVKSVILIRRDNIGDLVCTTPVIRALKAKYPQIKIGLLVNSYNAEAVRNNPDVDEVFVWEKEKHSSDKGALRVALGNFNLIRRVRARKFEAAVGCSYSYSKRLERYTFLTGSGIRIGHVPMRRAASRLFYNRPVVEPDSPIHEVEAMMRLVEPLGVAGPPPPMFVRPSEDELKKALLYLKRVGLKENEGLVAMQISSRKPQNRWPRERFKELGDMIQGKSGLRVMLLWAPGSGANALHPGDDEKADWLISSMEKRPLVYRTGTLPELIAAMSLADAVVSPDGGAMHIAAALGKPVLTIWGSTDRKRWAPWGVPHVILQKETKLAEAVSSGEAFEAFTDLYSKASGSGTRGQGR